MYHQTRERLYYTLDKNKKMTKEKRISGFNSYLEYEIGMFHDGELLLKKSLPTWILKTSILELKTLLQHYHEIVKKHVKEMEVFFEEDVTEFVTPRSNIVMKSLTDDVDCKLEICTDHNIADVCIVAGIQIINHYKISGYGTLGAISEMLKKNKTGLLFRMFENNEKQMDTQLTDLAMHGINQSAISALEI